jgi:hypothetical protein
MGLLSSPLGLGVRGAAREVSPAGDDGSDAARSFDFAADDYIAKPVKSPRDSATGQASGRTASLDDQVPGHFGVGNEVTDWSSVPMADFNPLG